MCGILCKSAEGPFRTTGSPAGVVEFDIKVMDYHLGFLEHLLEWFNPL